MADSQRVCAIGVASCSARNPTSSRWMRRSPCAAISTDNTWVEGVPHGTGRGG